MNHTECIRDIFTDLLDTDLSNFDDKKDKYWGFSLSQLIRMILNAKEILITHCETQKEQSIFALSGGRTLVITNKDKKILKKFNIFKLYCAKCNSIKRKDDENKILYCCSSCKLVRYCCSECQTNDWVHHKLICKCLTKAISNNEEIPNAGPVILRNKDKNGNVSPVLIDTTKDAKTDDLMKILKDHRKEKGSNYK